MIKILNLSKKFEDYNDINIAIDKVTCSIPDGCIYGLAGSNGAGKSTLIRLLCGVYKADSGNIILNIAYLTQLLWYITKNVVMFL